MSNARYCRYYIGWRKIDAISFSEQSKKFCLSYHYNGAITHLLVNDVEIYKFKAKDSKINAPLFHLSNISKDFSADNMNKVGLYGNAYDFFSPFW